MSLSESSVPAAVLPSEQRDGSATTADGAATSGPEATSLQGTLSNVRTVFEGETSLPRQLVLTYSTFDYLCAAVYARSKKARMTLRTIAYAHLKMHECRLELDSAEEEYTLWVGHTAFDVTRAEAATIHATFAPLGLKSKYAP